MADRAKVSAQIRAREAEVQAFVERLRRILDRSLEEILTEIETGKVSGLEAARILEDMLRTLKAAGYEREVGRLEAVYTEELRAVFEAVRDAGAASRRAVLTASDEDIIEALIRTDIARVTGTIDALLGDARSTLMRAVVAGELPDVRAVRDRFGERVASNLRTELNTSLQAFNRTVTITKAKDVGFELFEYLGPDDNVTRDFCEAVLNDRDPPIYSLDEIARMDNGQGLDVLTHGGGYNCRHQWRPISEEDAREAGWEG